MMEESTLRGVFIEHQPDAPAGFIGDRARERGIGTLTVRAGIDDFPDPADFDFVCPLGYGGSAYDDDVEFLPGELELLRRADAAGTPVFGICFGSQALARALGGSVRPGTRPEIGWHEVDTDAPALIEPGPWLVWHFDVLTPPPGAQEIARTALAVQAYRRGPHLGVQFHPEATPQAAASWAQTYADAISELGNDPVEIIAESERRAPQARRRAAELFDRFLAHAGLDVREDGVEAGSRSN